MTYPGSVLPNTGEKESSTGDERPPARQRLVAALEHGIDVLDVVAADGPIGVSDVARRIGLSKAAAHGLLATLESRGLVERDEGSSSYRLGWRLYEFAGARSRPQSIARVARRHLEMCAARIGETVLLGIPLDDGVLFIDGVESAQPLRTVAMPGRRVPFHSTASGKAILAAAGEQLIDRAVAVGLTALTGRTITNADELRTHIAEVRARGFAVAREENEPGLTSVAVAIRGDSLPVLGVLTTSGPSGRFTKRMVEDSATTLTSAAEAIAGELRLSLRP